VRVNTLDVAKIRMASLEKRMDPDDQSSTNVGYLTHGPTSWDSTALSSPTPAESDTATSRQPPSTGFQPGSTDNPPPHPGQADNRSPWHSLPSSSVSTDDLLPLHSLSSYSLSTDDLLPLRSVSTGYSPPLHSVPPDDPPPSHSVPPPDDPPPSHSVPPPDGHSPPGVSQRPGAPEFENFLGKFMKGRFKRRISGYGPGDVVQRESTGTVGPSAYVSTPSLPLLPTFTPPE
jgi:hypothetical protein